MPTRLSQKQTAREVIDVSGKAPFFYRISSGVRISVRPSYLSERSNIQLGQHVFVYHIRIENVGTAGAQLRSRRWLIHDDAIGETVVEGDGVVGEQPHLLPGQVHEYRSFCVLRATSGWMEGSYHFVRDDGSSFEAQIPRFILQADPRSGSVA